MTVINVPTVGAIRVTPFARKSPDQDGMGPRWYHRVKLDGERFGTDTWIGYVGQPRYPVPAQFSLYDTVHAAMSFADADGFDIDPWIGCVEIPIGYAEALLPRHGPRSDNVESWRTDGTVRHKRIKVTRGYDESAWDGAWRALSGWSCWEDAGTFDSGAWHTVPVEVEPTRRDGIYADAIPCVRHRVTWSGEITRWLDDMMRQAKREGRAW